jgi:EAL domain-containing protein (putative c-di-GMP-specific phosphodiesterase class I)
VAGIYARGSLGDFDLRHLVQRAELREGIRRGEVVFYYQPLAESRTRRVVGFEALARWQHPMRGLIEPARFIPLAERDEPTMWELTLLSVDRALADLRTWGDAAADTTVSINVSSVSLGRRDLARAFSRLLEKHRLPAWRLAVEITETSLLGFPPAAAQALHDLKRLGVRIVLDDFGTGYSSITRLGRLPFDTLKVDLHLIGLPPASDASRILRAMIELAQALQLRVVVERVEDDGTWDEVAQMGCDLIQGFRLCPPIPANEVPEWLRQGAAAAGAGAG